MNKSKISTRPLPTLKKYAIKRTTDKNILDLGRMGHFVHCITRKRKILCTLSHIQLQHLIHISSNSKMLKYWMHLNILHKYHRFPPKLYSVIVIMNNYYEVLRVA